MWTHNILFFIAVVVTILLARYEVRRYADVRLKGPVDDFEKRRFTRRMIGALILSVVLAMTYFGYINKEGFIGRPWFFAFYWIMCLLMAFSLILLALLDIRAVFKHSIKNYMDEDNEADRLERFLSKDRNKIKE
jgi:UDP-N-acetylmuramyl pentapeptide phosphotransferase/UDP-N-acetylglucosamine-1-phosphate transferase